MLCIITKCVYSGYYTLIVDPQLPLLCQSSEAPRHSPTELPPPLPQLFLSLFFYILPFDKRRQRKRRRRRRAAAQTIKFRPFTSTTTMKKKKKSRKGNNKQQNAYYS